MLVAVAASHGKKVFDGAILTARYAFDAMGAAYGGEVLVRGVDSFGAMAANAEALAQARRVGRDFVS